MYEDCLANHEFRVYKGEIYPMLNAFQKIFSGPRSSTFLWVATECQDIYIELEIH
jgi:hypothetical protein